MHGGKRLRAVLSGHWGYVCAAVGSAVTFAMLFEPWLSTGTGGTDGTIESNAFGRLHVTTFWVDLWAQSSELNPTASGAWGILTSIAIFIAVGSTAVNCVARTEVLTRMAIVATVFVAIFAVATALYLNSKGPELTQVVSFGTARDPGTQIGLLLRWAKGHDNYPAPGLRRVSYATASLTWTALIAVTISLSSVVLVIVQWVHGRKVHAQARSNS